MNKTSLLTLPVLALGLVMFSACGGDSSSAPAPPTTAELTLSTEVISPPMPDNTTINSYDVTITLPEGVTVDTKPNSTEIDDGVVTAAGTVSGALISGSYTASSGAIPGTVTVRIYKVDPETGAGFDPGVFCKVKGNISNGHAYTASDFEPITLDDATGWDSGINDPVYDMQNLLSVKATVSIW